MQHHDVPLLRSASYSSRARRARIVPAAFMLPAFFAMACVTVNIYFPAPEVREAAEQIVDETWGAAPPAPGPRSAIGAGILRAAVVLLSPREASAAEVNVDVSTAAIRALKDSMRQRASELKPHMSAGAVGIGDDGMLVERDAAAVDLATRAKLRRLIDAENKDRDALYREIATANNYGAERVADIRAIFAATWKDKAERGWWIRDGGTWRQK